MADSHKKKTKSPTMHDVARLAGVSIATVSSVINEKNGVSLKRTASVKDAMSKLDYHPDLVARSLKLGHTKVIGMIVPDVTNQYYPEVMRGVEDEARVHGYQLMLCNSNENPDQEQHLLSMLFSQRVDGVLLASSDSTAVYDRQIRRRFPIVFIDRLPSGCTERAVITNNVQAAYDATRHLISLGHKRIAIIAGNTLLSTGSDRVAGYRQAMQEAHLPIHEEYFRHGDFTLESGIQCGLELMNLKTPPTAIFSCNNKMTLGLMKSLTELNISCPKKVSVVSFDDFEWAAYFTPQLTTVSQQTYQIGKNAMQMLVRIINSEKNKIYQKEDILMLPAKLLVRNSTTHAK